MRYVLKGIGTALFGGLAAAVIVGGLAYTQEGFWNAIGLSLGPDWAIAAIMGGAAFLIVFVSTALEH